MWYEIWDRETGNLLLDANDEVELLGIVAATVAADGRDAVATWFLVGGNDAGHTGTILAEGDALAERSARVPAAVHGDN